MGAQIAIVDMSHKGTIETKSENLKMNKLMIKLYVTLQALRDERGQDLIEYVLIGGVVAVGAIAGMGNLAANLNAAFGNIATKVSSYS